MAVEFESTNRGCDRVSFKEALIRGQAPDRGLYTPVEVPRMGVSDLEGFSSMSYHEIARHLAMLFLEGEIPSEEVGRITREAYDFDVPIEHVFDSAYVMRLDRGPTASFKDFAARMMARLMSYFLGEDDSEALILTATSGDTGSAVANAFHGLENVRVVVLFPEKEVTGRQRRQMTTLGGNVSTISVDGKFDDCQALVKRAFSDSSLDSLRLSSANSINFGRLLPQSFYYVYAYSRLAGEGDEIVFSVPSGNFGDLMGGIVAREMGLPVKRFVVATNENDEFPEFLKTGVYKPLRPSRACISNAMNVGHPSNLARLFHVYGGWIDETGRVRENPDVEAMRGDLWAVSVSDDETRKTIKDAYERHGLLLEPHGAVGWKALVDYLASEGGALSVSLETADPAKFPEEIESLLGFEPELPDSLKGLDDLEENVTPLENDYDSLRKFLQTMR
ncbi:MAG: threonine synthase [Candidatus Altiarchaeales archaeon]|nr:threonine synthase [Candidatus Altiarchaeales archaeon]MBD3416196.1 threonine synthase [Candidatus Altiarchaeales archaeon]